MKKSIIFALIIFLSVLFIFPVSLDIKTKFSEKSELTSIKIGASYYLLKDDIIIIDIGEDFSIWLKDLEIIYISSNEYTYELSVKLSFPTTFKEKRTIREERISFHISTQRRENPSDNKLLKKLERHFSNLSNRIYNEANLGGKIVANSIKRLLYFEGVLTD